MVPGGQLLEVVEADPFFAAILAMALQGELSLRQPAVQRFDIDAQFSAGIGQRDEGHGITPFRTATGEDRDLASGHMGVQMAGKLPGLLLSRPNQATGRVAPAC